MIREIERNLKIDDNILKFITVKTRDPFNPETLEEERKKEQLLQDSQIPPDEPEPVVPRKRLRKKSIQKRKENRRPCCNPEGRKEFSLAGRSAVFVPIVR